jgi:RimJ/RimL family protein N-acetyltransferase
MARDAPAWDETKVDFRFLRADDLPRLHAWLNTESVKRWWEAEGDDLSVAGVLADYTPLLEGSTSVTAFIAEYSGEPVGYVQRYDPHDHPDYWGGQELPRDYAGIDLLIGDARFLGRGFGPVMIRAFLRRIVFADPAVRGCLIDPHPDNRIAIRAYEKVGFRHDRTIGPPQHRTPAYLMVLDRDAFFAHAGGAPAIG